MQSAWWWYDRIIDYAISEGTLIHELSVAWAYRQLFRLSSEEFTLNIVFRNPQDLRTLFRDIGQKSIVTELRILTQSIFLTNMIVIHLLKKNCSLMLPINLLMLDSQD